MPICDSCASYNKDLSTCDKNLSVFDATIIGSCSQYTKSSKYKYKFKRKMYYSVLNSIHANHVTFLLGPRKCGKTVCLHQIEYENSNVLYIDVKRVIDRKTLVKDICEKIYANIDEVIIVDECTYLDHPAEDIQTICTCYDEVESRTRIVFSGSQSVSLEVWANRTYSGNTGIVYSDFISFTEWLQYKSLSVCEESYLDFIENVDTFYGFKSCEAYLKGCLNETVISNSKAIDIIPNNDCDLLTADILMLVLYAILFSKHNHISYIQFANRNLLSADLNRVSANNVLSDTTELFSRLKIKYELFSTLTADVIKQAIVFLFKCNLITVSKVVSSVNEYRDPMPEFFNDYIPLDKNRLFKDYNFAISYPMFYIGIIKSLGMSEHIIETDRAILGSLVECHIKGLLSDRFCIEYHDELGREIDCIDLKQRIAVESSVSDRHSHSTLSDVELDGYRKVLTTSSYTNPINSIERIPYYQFICDLESNTV